MKYFVGILLLALVAGGIYLFFFAGYSVSLSGNGFGVAQQSASNPNLKPARPAPAGYKEYRNEQLRFQLFYPDNLDMSIKDEGAGAATIKFQNIKTGEGFQIFAVPYSGAQITEARFKMDEPSGVRKSPQNITVDSTPAVSFYSTDTNLKDTAEVWMIKSPYLFEVTTLKPLDSWLSGIMGSWQFI